MSNLPPCPICQASHTTETTYAGSCIVWLICQLCGYVWCADPNVQPC